MRKPRLVAPAFLAVVLAAAWAYAQQQPRGRIWAGGDRRVSPHFATEGDFNGSFLYCRGYYTSRFREGGGGGWRTDYPGADNNFSVRLAELTTVHVHLNPDRQPNTVVVSLSDPLLFRCPMLFMEDVGTAEFTDAEVQNLRDFFQKGGFLWVDDAWGSYAWANWVEQIGRVLPPGEFPIFDIPATHPIMSVLYAVKDIPQVPNIGFWVGSGGQTSERGYDSAQVYFRGIQDSHKRLMVVMTHNTDISDTWEREGEFPREYFDLFSPRGYAIGVNVVLYAMTH
jgi:hypothetical protein